MDTTELELELLNLESIYENTRNSIEKTQYADLISQKKAEIAAAKLPEVEQKVILQKDVPARADHVDEVKPIERDLITNPGDTFKMIL